MVEYPVEQAQQPREPDLELLIDWEHGWNRPKPWYSAAGSVIAHILIGLVLMIMPARDYVMPADGPRVVVDVRKAVPLVAPPDILTQKAPNQSTPVKQIDLAGLMSRPEQKPLPAAKAAPPPTPKQFTAPPSPVVKKPDRTIQEAEPIPKIAQSLPPALGTNAANPSPVAPPPQVQQEKPKLAFETPGAITGTPKGQIQAPTQMSVAEVARAAAQRGPAGGMVISDLGGDPTPGLPAVPGTQGKTGNSLELLSDPLGVDFRPYLIRVLAAVRRNWFAVMPESAHMGMRGKAVIQFAISKDGSVPKLVIQSPSGSDHLDRAAVAGISASNPFPPLPAEFKGQQIRLQLVFAYNLRDNDMLRLMSRLLLFFLAAVSLLNAQSMISSGPPLPHQVVKDWAKLPEGWNFGETSGVTVDKNDNVWVFNRGPHGVMQFDKTGKLLQSWKEIPVTAAHGIKVDPSGNVWAIDVKGHMLFQFNTAGRIQMVIGNAGKQPGNNDSKDAFNEPTAVSFMPDGSFYVSDGYKNSRVVKFDAGGVYQFHWGSKGTGDGQFNLVHDVALDGKGRVYVADRLNERVQVFDLQGKFLNKWVGLGAPWGLAYAAKDSAFYMCDGVNNRIIKVNLEGQILGVLSGYGKVQGRLDFPHHIAVDSEGSIYVAEIKNWRVQKFAVPR